MNAQDLLERAHAAGLHVIAEADHLRVRGPKQFADLARLLIQHKVEVINLLALFSPRIDGTLISGDGDETKPLREKIEVSSPYQPCTPQRLANPARIIERANPPAGCGSLHIQPQKWTHSGAKAYCPRCDRFMGYLGSDP